MGSKEEDDPALESQESLLYSARHGELKVVKALLEARKEGKLTLDINCKGQSKSNLGWTPLQLATYFGHVDVVEALLEAGADVDEVNDNGDTALHKASFIGNEELVILLVNHKADVNIMNGEGRTALDVCKTRDVQRLLEAAQKSERKERERKLLNAAKDGRIEEVQELLNSPNSPSINCADAQGNTCLHCAAYRGHARLAVLLLQNGVDTTLRNNSGQLAIDLAKDNEMREVLSVRPVQRLQRTAARFEGPLQKRSRFLGWRPVWAVLQRGVLLYYGSRAEAAREGGRWRARKYLDAAKVTAPATEPALIIVNFSDGDTHRLAVLQQEKDVAACRQSTLVTVIHIDLLFRSRKKMWLLADKWGRARKYLDAAKVTAPQTEPALIIVNFSDGDTHRLAVPQQEKDVAACRQSWVTALNEHIAYSGHYLWAGASPDAAKEATEEVEDECKPLGSMQDALTAATNHLAILETQLRECAAILAALERTTATAPVGTSLHHSAYMRFQHACGTGQDALASLRHAAALVAQARDADSARLQREIERNRVLEEALAALARTHHALEMSVAEELTKSKRKKKSTSSSIHESKENFYDVFEGSDDEDDTLVTAGLDSPLGALSPWGSIPDLAERRTPIGSLDGDKTPTNDEVVELQFRDLQDLGTRRLSGSSGSPTSLHTALSPASSRGTLVSQGGNVYRNARPYRKNTKHSSQWSL
ncbi:ankyrin repeats (many copies) domain-containing protein [Phthorimaea operculella]|nr:ankyrin repeats (many copies) domain-containing protein [Phthorimaea operculella]